MRTYLDFEKPVAALETKIDELRRMAGEGDLNIADEIARLEQKAERIKRQTFANLTPWQKVQIARHPERPHGLAFIEALFNDFTPLAGDRAFGDDKAIMGGLARFRGTGVVVMAHEKGHDISSRITHHFGTARPEGYRKSRRLFDLANRFQLPVISFIDTAGAYPGVDAEARGQSEAIARSIEAGLNLMTPMIAIIIGEGGSGGAIAIATGNVVLMLQHAVYSVISPEGCASILWRNGAHAADAAEAMKITAEDLLQLGLIDEIIAEPLGGAHREPHAVIRAVGDTIERWLAPLLEQDGATLRAAREEKFLAMGAKGLS